jgi:hypothetical protein
MILEWLPSRLIRCDLLERLLTQDDHISSPGGAVTTSDSTNEDRQTETSLSGRGGRQ